MKTEWAPYSVVWRERCISNVFLEKFLEKTDNVDVRIYVKEETTVSMCDAVLNEVHLRLEGGLGIG
jgi:hypothetical protein